VWLTQILRFSITAAFLSGTSMREDVPAVFSTLFTGVLHLATELFRGLGSSSLL
jgi:hypothetical protein